MAATLTLVVNNTAVLEGGTRSSATFAMGGGVIGSAPDCDWELVDRQQTVEPRHLRVFFTDGHYCLEPLSARGVRVNRASHAVQQGEAFQITDGDTLSIGRFDVTAYVVMQLDDPTPSGQNSRWAQKFVSVETILNPKAEEDEQRNLLDNTLVARKGHSSLEERLRQRAEGSDPLGLLYDEAGPDNPTIRDPLDAMDRELPKAQRVRAASLADYIDGQPNEGHRPETPDDFQPTSAYFAPQRVTTMTMNAAESSRSQSPDNGGRDELDNYLAELEGNMRDRKERPARNAHDVHKREAWLGEVPALNGPDVSADELVDHVVMRPLCAALGLPIKSMTGPEADQLATDVGEALKSAIEGLMALNRRQETDRSLLAETHLHAIEDNPLRLAQSSSEAVHDLFLVQSPVHLSAKSAIEESLSVIEHHQDASRVATEAALNAVLMALSPVALAKRFLKYKGHAPRTGDLDAWHWGMYQHYYKEMASDRQGGLSRMFGEVFRQVYDREMRARSVEQ